MGVWRDCSWRTGLGTCFYDRRWELGTLRRLVGGGGWGRVYILYGPGGVGKSELGRYVAGRLDAMLVHIDARRRVVEGLLGWRVEPSGWSRSWWVVGGRPP